jgi:hypothetical protein
MNAETTDRIVNPIVPRREPCHRRAPIASSSLQIRKLILLGVTNLLVAGNVWAAFHAPSQPVAASVCSNSVSLTWADPNPSESGERAILVQRSTRGPKKGFSIIASLPAYATSFTDTNVEAATTYYYRVAAVNAKGRKFNSPAVAVVTPAPAVLSPDGIAQVPDTGGYNYTVSVTSTVTCIWSAYSMEPWISIDSGSSGVGSGTVTYSVAENTDTTSRTGTVMVANQPLKVTQAGKTCSFVLTPTGALVGAGGGSGSFTVSTSKGCKWSAIANVGWLHTSSSGNGSGSASYTVDPNAGGDPRTGTVSVGDQSFTVTQSASGVTITTSSSPSAGGSTTGGGTYAGGSTVTVVATPGSCYSFVNWTENGAVVSTSASYTFTATTNRSLVANFTPVSYTITTGSSPSAGGTTSGGGSKACGSTVTVSATANTGYAFVNWTENGLVVSTSPNYSFTASANRTLIANFSQITYAITTASSPSSGGTTTGGGTYASGATATIAASPSSCYSFVNWTENGTVVSTSANYSFIVTGNRALVANFAQTSYTVTTTASPSAGGTTSGGGSKSCGSTVTVSAAANSGYTFVNWTENGSVVSTSANYSFTVTGNRALVANFSQSTYTVATSPSPSTGGTTAGGGTYASGQTATVVATANSCYAFVNWTENGSVVSTSANYSFTVTGNRNLVANFSQVSYTVATSSSPAAGGTTSGGGNKSCGSTATLTAIPNSGYSFANWTENGVVVSTSSSYSFTVTGNRTLVANFTSAPVNYTITTSASPAEGGATSGGGTYTSGSSVTVRATPNTGYSFVNWTENGTVVSTSADYSFSATANRSLVANFTTTSGGGPWAMGIGGASADMGQAVARDANGNIFVAGYFMGSVNFGGGALTSAGGMDIFVAKYSPTGSHLWSKRFGGSGDDAAQSIAVDLNGDVVVGGYYSGSATIGSASYTSLAGRDAFVMKLSGSSGAAQWSKSLGGEAWSSSTPDDYSYGVATDPRNGDVVVTGQISGWVYFDGNLVICAGPDTFLAKYTSGGVYQWAKTFGMGGTDYGKGVAVDGSGNIVLAGNTTGPIDLGGGLLPFNTSGGYLNFFVGKFTGAGGHVWSGCYGGVYGSFANSVAVDGSGNVLVTGYFSGTMSVGAVSVSGLGASQTAFVAKLLGSSGGASWAKSLTTTVMAAGNGVAADGSGNVVLTGYFQGSLTPAGGSALSSAGGYDGFVVKYNSAGGYVWGERVGGASSDWGNAITTDGSGNVITTGATNGGDFSGQTLTSNGGFDIFLLKLAP